MSETLSRVRAPGKLIISGEHSVVYGCPALALAVDKYAESSLEVTNKSKDSVCLEFQNLNYAEELPLIHLSKFYERVNRSYQDFLSGNLEIEKVLKKPDELLQYTVCSLLKLFRVHTNFAMKIVTASNIPVGCGMGSSAATISTVVWLLANFLGKKVDSSTCAKLAALAERVQHGTTSGLDVQIVQKGGCFYYADSKLVSRSLPNFPLYIVNTGRPLSSTGETVSYVRRIFSTTLCSEFTEVTNYLDKAIQDKSKDFTEYYVKENHRLLCHLGVVPPKVQAFIKDLEKLGAAAKICGAGTVRGDEAGVILVVADSNLAVDAAVKEYGYQFDVLKGDADGVKIL